VWRRYGDGCAGVVVERSRSAEEPLGSRIPGCDWLCTWQKERTKITCISDTWNVEGPESGPTSVPQRGSVSPKREVVLQARSKKSSSQTETCQPRATSAAIERFKINRRLFVHIDQGDITTCQHSEMSPNPSARDPSCPNPKGTFQQATSG
jgi:hypothetical protein